VSFVDSDIGVAAVVADATLRQRRRAVRAEVDKRGGAQNEDEEAPPTSRSARTFVSRAVQAVLSSPLWPRVLLVWLYDEHGGYYDHVPRRRDRADAIAPSSGRTTRPAATTFYGPRVPAVVVSATPSAAPVTSVVHDHTSILRRSRRSGTCRR